MRSVTTLLAALLATLAVLAPGHPAARPDVVVIVIDTLRRDHLPSYGYAKDTAPFLTALGEESVVFQNAYSTSSWTAPATASIFTSLYPFQHGVVTGRMAVRELQKNGTPIKLNRIPRRAETLGEAMRKAGYATWAVTENSNVSPALGFDQGFEHFHALHHAKVAEAITARLFELKAQILAKRPYFLYLHYMDVHAPYNTNPPLFDASLRGDARRVSAYDSEIRHLDEHLQRTFDAFGWSERTALIVTADHGEELLDHGAWGHARTLFAEVLNVPLLVRLPGVKAKRVDERVSHVDLLPTLRAIAGLPRAPGDAGLSLLPLVRGAAGSLPERTLLADLWQAPGGKRRPYLKAAIRGRYKQIHGMPEGELLFDLDADPMDLQNRARAYPAIAAALHVGFERLEARSAKLVPEFEHTILDQGLNEELKALGYVN